MYKKPINLYKKLYSSFFTIYTKKNIDKNMKTIFSYIVFFKRIYFVSFGGKVLRFSKKNYSINQTLTIIVRLKKEIFFFNLPIQTRAVSIF